MTFMSNSGIIYCTCRTISSVGQSSRLITGRSKVRVLDGPPKKGSHPNGWLPFLVDHCSPQPCIKAHRALMQGSHSKQSRRGAGSPAACAGILPHRGKILDGTPVWEATFFGGPLQSSALHQSTPCFDARFAFPPQSASSSLVSGKAWNIAPSGQNP